MKQLFSTVLAAALVACGGGGSDTKDPTKVVLEYDTPVTPEGNAASAAVTAQETLGTLEALDGDLTEGAAQAIYSLPDTLASQLVGDAGGGGVAKSAKVTAAVRKAMQVSIGQMLSTWDDPSCVTVGVGVITFDHCTDTSTDEFGYTELLSVNGSMRRTISGGAATVAWNTTVSMRETYEGEAYSFTTILKSTGAITVDGSTIVGLARSDLAISEVDTGYSFGFTVSSVADYDLGYTTTAGFCLDSGSLEVKRVWLARPYGVPALLLPDLGAKFFFGPGCNEVTVALSIPPAPNAPTATVSCRASDGCSELTGPITSDFRSWLRDGCEGDGGTFASGACSSSGMVGACFLDEDQTVMGGGWFSSKDWYPADLYTPEDAAYACGLDGGTWQPVQ